MFFRSFPTFARRFRRLAARLLPVLGLCALIFGPAPPSLADAIPSPDYLVKRGIDAKTNFLDLAETFIGIPFREDGTLDEQGRFTQFEYPDRNFDSPGFNCSGFVLSASRYLIKRNITLEHAKHDRLGDSGPKSPLGDSWDFGWDLIFNLAQGLPIRILGPHEDVSQSMATGETLRGFDLTDEAAWKAVFADMSPGRMYLATLSKPSTRLGARLRHYHVALLLADEKGGRWFYHATLNSRTHKMNLATPQGMNRLKAQFSGDLSKKILIIEINPPGLAPPPGQPPQ